MTTRIDEIEAALAHLDSHDRINWVRIGAAIKTELGEAGFDVWNNWSQNANNYNAKAALATWKNLKPGRINIATLFYQARKEGYQPSKEYTPPSAKELEERREKAEAAAKAAALAEKEAQSEAAKRANNRYYRLPSIEQTSHPYLQRKGISDPKALRQIKLDGDRIVLPLRKYGKIVGLQDINGEGRKLFTKGMELSGASLVIGDWNKRNDGLILTEGFATAASIHAATGKTVLVCFAGHNLETVARGLPRIDGEVTIAADYDASQAGYQYALKAKEALNGRAKIVMPRFTEAEKAVFKSFHGSIPSDFNDLHQMHGSAAVAEQVNAREYQPSEQSLEEPENELKAIDKKTNHILDYEEDFER